MTMRKLLAVGFATFSLVACSGGSGGKAHPTLTNSPLPDLAAMGRVVGQFLAVGGPAGAKDTPQHGRLLLRQHDQLPMRVQVPRSGYFDATIPAGTYSIVGYSPQYMDGRVACHAVSPTVTVRGGATTRINVYCQRR